MKKGQAFFFFFFLVDWWQICSSATKHYGHNMSTNKVLHHRPQTKACCFIPACWRDTNARLSVTKYVQMKNKNFGEGTDFYTMSMMQSRKKKTYDSRGSLIMEQTRSHPLSYQSDKKHQKRSNHWTLRVITCSSTLWR